MKKNTKTSNMDLPKWTVLTPKQVAKLNAVGEAHHRDNPQPVYPEPGEATLADILLGNTNGLAAVGGVEGLKALGWDNHQLDITVDDIEDYRGGRRRQRGNRGGNQQRSGGGNKGGSKGGSGGGRGKTGGNVLLNPQIVLAAVQKKIAATGAKPVDMSGKIVFGCQNFEMLTKAKAAWFADSYKEFIPLAHVWMCVEIGKEGIEEIARLTGYTAYCSTDNSRGNQAVAILIHPRVKFIAKSSIDEVANVQGVNDLRPLLKLDLEDTAPQTPDAEKKFFAGVVHLKSMRGGEVTSGAVRYQQCQIIANKLSGNGVVGGDWNMKLPGVKDYSPLTAANFTLVDPGDSRNTHIMGSRLDGFFTLNFSRKLSGITLLDWFTDPTIGRGLTDHAGLNV
jgi:hypothetical protein